MAGLTEAGFSVQRFVDTIAGLEASVSERIDRNLSVNYDSVISPLLNIYALEDAGVWETGQGIWDSFDIFSAEGESLDNVGTMLGYVRLSPSRTRGEVEVTATDGSPLPQGYIVRSVTNKDFRAVTETRISSTLCYSSRMYINNIVANSSYVIVINDAQFIYTSDADPTVQEILEGVADLVESEGLATAEVILGIDETDSYLLIVKKDKVDTISLNTVSTMRFDYVESPVTVEATELGVISAPIGTVNTVVEPRLAQGLVHSVTNKTALATGSEEETDYVFRQRLINSYARILGATTNSMLLVLTAVPNVTDVKIKENTTRVTDADGLPPNSFQIIVRGGSVDDIANTIWRTKPAGIENWTDSFESSAVVTNIRDFNDQTHIIKFKRPDITYLYTVVNFTLYDEELLLNDTESLIASSCVQYTDTLNIGDDVVPKRMNGYIYGNTTGIDATEIWLGSSDDLSVPPNWPSDYDLVTIPISDEEISSLTTDRVTFNRSSRTAYKMNGTSNYWRQSSSATLNTGTLEFHFSGYDTSNHGFVLLGTGTSNEATVAIDSLGRLHITNQGGFTGSFLSITGFLEDGFNKIKIEGDFSGTGSVLVTVNDQFVTDSNISQGSMTGLVAFGAYASTTSPPQIFSSGYMMYAYHNRDGSTSNDFEYDFLVQGEVSNIGTARTITMQDYNPADFEQIEDFE
jgi:uncharacterized phage protein gp47/JayE